MYTLNPTYKSFSPTARNITTDQTVQVKNDSTNVLTFGSLTGLAAPFSLVDDNVSGASLTPNDTSTVVVRFTPTSLSTFSDTLVFPSDDPDTTSVDFLVDGTAQEAVLSTSIDYKYFGNVTNTSTTDQTVTVTNNGNIALTVGTLSGLSAPFSLQANHVSDATIGAGDSSTFVLRYHPTTNGTTQQTLSIPSNDLSSPKTMAVDGTSQSAIIGVSPTLKHFGNQANLSTTDQTVTVSNSGNIALVMGTLTGLAAPYSLVNNNVSGASISASDSSTVVLRYHPTAYGVSSDTLVIPSNDLSTPYNFAVDGTSQEADIDVSPTSVVFGLKTVGTSSTAVVTVTNLGNIDLIMAPVTGLAAPFSVTNDNVSDATVSPSASVTLTVVYTPTSTANVSDTLVIASNDPDEPTADIVIEGQGGALASYLGQSREYIGINQIQDHITGSVLQTYHNPGDLK